MKEAAVMERVRNAHPRFFSEKGDTDTTEARRRVSHKLHPSLGGHACHARSGAVAEK